MKFKNPVFFALLVCVGLSACIANRQYEEIDLASRVDPMIGTDGHGHTYPGVSLPFGMVQLSPDTRVSGWDACSGYHYSDSTIIGFSHTHLSGTGSIDYGDVLLMPTVGKPQIHPGSESHPEEGYRSRFSHEKEVARAGFYSVELADYEVKVELTASQRVGLHRYSFPETDQANVILDLLHGLGPDRVQSARVEVINDREVVGYRKSMGWANHQQLFFALEFSKPFQKFALVKDEEEVEGKVAGGKGLKAWFRFDARQESQVLVKVGISAVSIEGARKNMKAELPGWDFESTRKKAVEQWNQELNRIQVKGAQPEQAAIFYTALYHSFLAPNLFSDVDGSYRGMDGEVHRNSRNDQYTIFSLWDTFRATHPLFTLVQEERTVDLINSLLSKYAESGQLPIWELAANETGTMIGYHSVPVIVDAYLKGIRGFDVEKAYEAIKASAMREDRGLNWYKKYEFIPMEREGNSVSKVLEYAYDDWCIAQMARELGEEEDYLLFIQRAQYYKNLYDKESGFMRGRSANGNWREEFDPASTSVLGGGDFTEGNSWQYSFFVPQDIEGFTALLGGSQQLIDKLGQLFSQSSVIDNAHTPDVSGLIGMYAHGNEPSHHVAYLYNYAGAPWKTQERVHQIMDSLYTHRPDGLCGNEDCGQMSAWYVMSAMGFYPVCPGSNEYAIGTPLFPETTINLENGNQFVIKAKQVSRENKYIQKVQLNGEAYSNSFLLHEDILAGGILEFEMGAQPNKKWGRRLENRPQSFIEEENRMEAIDARRVMLPYVVNKGRIFGSRMLTELACNTPGAEIFYTLDGSEPSRKSFRYLKPIVLNHSLELKAKAFKKGMQPSLELKEEFIRAITHEPGRKYPQIIERTEASAPYNKTGDFALLDGVRGSDNFGDGNWTGFNGNNLEMVIDLGRRVPLNRITLSYLQNTGSWIFPPRRIQFALSDDGKTFRTVNESGNNEPQDHLNIGVRRVSHEFSKQRSRFVKIVAENFGKLPEWHSGAGNDAWLFVDEVVIE